MNWTVIITYYKIYTIIISQNCITEHAKNYFETCYNINRYSKNQIICKISMNFLQNYFYLILRAFVCNISVPIIYLKILLI